MYVVNTEKGGRIRRRKAAAAADHPSINQQKRKRKTGLADGRQRKQDSGSACNRRLPEAFSLVRIRSSGFRLCRRKPVASCTTHLRDLRGRTWPKFGWLGGFELSGGVAKL